MPIKSIKALWGMKGSLESMFEQIAAAGYSGVESPLPDAMEKLLGIPAKEKQFRSLLESYKLDYIAMIFTDADDHAESFRNQVESAATYVPILINSHSAKDSMPFHAQAVCFEKMQAIEQNLAIPVGHETHRGRAMFTPWTTAALLREFPDLKLVADFSHWVCVCESLLEDQKDNLDLAIQRTIHIHARVGHAQGPQVSHPAAPEYANEHRTHENWWKTIIHKHKYAGTLPTFTPEFGPPRYMPTMPFTDQPVADLWDVCLWMKNQVEQLSNDTL